MENQMDIKTLVESQFEDVVACFPCLILHWYKSIGIIEGEIVVFDKDTDIVDTFHIRILITERYPSVLPFVCETDKRIPKTFHYSGDYFCLGAPTEVKLRFQENPTLKFFIEEFVVNYLYSYCYFVKNKKMPFGERSHDEKGIYESYMDMFQVDSKKTVMKFLKLLSGDRTEYHGANFCTCNSGKKAGGCHGKILLDLFDQNIPRDFQKDLRCLRYKN